MCDPLTDQQFLEQAQATGYYKVVDTRYNADGQIARTYREEFDGSFWAVLPGTGNYRNVFGSCSATAQQNALAHLDNNGYTLTSMPETDSVAPSEVVQDSAQLLGVL